MDGLLIIGSLFDLCSRGITLTTTERETERGQERETERGQLTYIYDTAIQAAEYIYALVQNTHPALSLSSTSGVRSEVRNEVKSKSDLAPSLRRLQLQQVYTPRVYQTQASPSQSKWAYQRLKLPHDLSYCIMYIPSYLGRYY